VSCFGRSGPNAEQPGNGTLAEAYAGLTHMTGEADGPPMLASLAVGDVVSAMSGALGTIAACYHRDARGGRGQHVDVSMVDPLLALSSNSLLDHAKRGRVARRQGSRIPGAVPRNVYRAGDGGWIVISAVTDRMVGKLLPAIGRDSPEDLALFATQEARRRHDDELDAAVAAWVAERPRAEVLRVLREAPVPAGPVNDAADLVADAHLAARGSLTTVVDPDLGALTMAGPAPLLSATPGRVRWSGAGVGEHNAEVYGEWLGLGADELARLREGGVI
jgi:crotonobetainyl-CoA:carnitine CoA-transferase CaiB-like acyl-CoA transferase